MLSCNTHIVWNTAFINSLPTSIIEYSQGVNVPLGSSTDYVTLSNHWHTRCQAFTGFYLDIIDGNSSALAIDEGSGDLSAIVYTTDLEF